MKKWAVVFLVLFSFEVISIPEARSDMFGADVVVLTQILVKTIEELAQLRAIIKNGSDSLGLMRDINRGINDSLGLLRTVSPNTDPGIFKNWRQISDAVRAVTDLYGIIVQSKDSRVQQSADQSVAEAVSLNNAIYDYSHQIDDIGEQIKSYSHSVSPGGAQKLTAQSMGIMLHVMNQGLRAQATSLKLQAQVVVLQNHKDKEASRETVELSDAFDIAIERQSPKFQTPRF